MVQFFGSAKIIIFTIFKLVPILWVSQFLGTIRYTEIFKRHNSVNSEGGVMALVLSTLSDGVLYFYQVLSK